jgi:NADPH-dependent curcumin reductase CurA
MQTMSRRVWIREVIDYKADSLADAVVRACPRGVDVYFDNTAGAISDGVLPQLAIGARVVICGTASVSSWDPPPMGPRVERHILVKRARMAGILVFDYQHRYEEAVTRLAEWVRQGHLRYREDIVDGIENCPGAMPDFTGEKTSVSGLFIFAITEVARTCLPLLLARTLHPAKPPSIATDQQISKRD